MFDRMNLAYKNYRLVFITVIAASVLFVCFTGQANAGTNLTMEGENVFIAGDSIQNGHQYKRYGAFIQRACEKLKADNIYNKAVSGATLANKNNQYMKSTYKQVMDNLKTIKKCRYVFISAGTNDYGGGVSGWAKSKQASKDLTKMIKTIHKTNPDAKIIVVTPIYRFRYCGTHVDCEKKKNGIDHKTLAQYRKIIKKAATKKKFRKYVMVVDGNKLITKKKMRSRKYTWDTLHPYAKTAKKYLSPALIKYLKKKADWLMKTDEPEPEPTPTPTPTPDPEPTPEQQPEPTPEQQPEPTPEQQPEPTPEQQPGPTPDDQGQQENGGQASGLQTDAQLKMIELLETGDL